MTVRHEEMKNSHEEHEGHDGCSECFVAFVSFVATNFVARNFVNFVA